MMPEEMANAVVGIMELKAEITRLRADLAKATENHAADLAEMEKLRGDVERLREALRNAAQHCPRCQGSGLAITDDLKLDLDCMRCFSWHAALAATEPKPRSKAEQALALAVSVATEPKP